MRCKCNRLIPTEIRGTVACPCGRRWDNMGFEHRQVGFVSAEERREHYERLQQFARALENAHLYPDGTINWYSTSHSQRAAFGAQCGLFGGMGFGRGSRS